MARPDRTPAPPSPANPLSSVAPVAPVAEWAWLMFSPMFDVQRMQMDALLGWQQAIATLQKDFWEQWAVRYGGGVPLE